GGLNFWWPKMTGRLYSEAMSKASAILVFVGFNLTFFPQFVLGYMGMPRRYYTYPDEWQVLNVLSTGGATVLGLGYTLTFAYLVYSLFKGAQAPANPWGAKGLEWEDTLSPPTTYNFDKDIIVDEPAYDYRPGSMRPGPEVTVG
ncbi:MAG TPA: cbb3-type cytochrome c oxidase subunit I, partial [Vicinamibacterales bacterium]|nr:cbb3-type cytochrome c oxidase subunit I [Vicinamibacterales bacterium]